MNLIRALLAACLVCACALVHAADDSLFQALGGKPGIAQVTRDLLALTLADPRIKDHFRDADLPRIEEQLIEQLCEVSGGPCTYRGKDMKTIHEDLHLTTADLNAMIENLQLALEKAGVPYATQNRLLARLAPMKRDIVTR